jgi:hypothetical protein
MYKPITTEFRTAFTRVFSFFTRQYEEDPGDEVDVTRNYPQFFAFNAFLSRLIDIPCKYDTV